MRSIIFATMGEALPVRLEFVGFGKRELQNVKPG